MVRAAAAHRGGVETLKGKSLKHYQVEEVLGKGGMGVVYRAVDTKLNREVAFKVLPAELINDPERKRRFMQEAQAAASLEHPHIATIYEVDEADGVTFLVMELIGGDKLKDTLERERLSLARGPVAVRRVADGAHRLERARDGALFAAAGRWGAGVPERGRRFAVGARFAGWL